ncbi:MAG: ribosome small subunit-dependent GTPase A [Candidatus Zixiibacteriota bacterium]|nr:MAG: ribosome small subunit-dependent GTPase A [candidate division Zixibacteria bacterium]
MCNDNIFPTLIQLGWNEQFEQSFFPFRNHGMVPGRIEREDRNQYLVACESGRFAAEVSGRFRNEARSRADFPAVGDWVALKPSGAENRAIIHEVLPRKSCFSRKAILSGGMPDTGGKTDQQVLAANIDTVFLVSGLDGDFNLRRIERFVTVAYDSGAAPAIILNKADLCSNLQECIQQVELIAIGIPIHAVSAVSGDGLPHLDEYLSIGRTVAFLGSSGVGKSTIINRLLGEERLRTTAVREYDGRGRHTTSHRELIVLPEGGIVIDSPGMREIQLWGDQDSLDQAFEDVEVLARNCRFNDCTHSKEPGCAIKSAIDTGELDPARFGNYLKLQKEIRHLQRRRNRAAARRAERARDKRYRQFHKELKKTNRKYQS